MLLFILLNLFWKATGEVYSSYEDVKHINKIENQLVRNFTTGCCNESTIPQKFPKAKSFCLQMWAQCYTDTFRMTVCPGFYIPVFQMI